MQFTLSTILAFAALAVAAPAPEPGTSAQQVEFQILPNNTADTDKQIVKRALGGVRASQILPSSSIHNY